MNKKNTYYPEDIEQLLLNKEFDELLPEEIDFVLQHVDSKDEYKLMRHTLLAIKKEVENDQSLKASPQIKEELLLLMEQKKNRAGWFNLNGFWSMLFPADVNFFQKPGFQFASIAVLIGFSFFIARVYVDKPNNNLAINSEGKEVQKEIIQDLEGIKQTNTEQRNKESNHQSINNPEQKEVLSGRKEVTSMPEREEEEISNTEVSDLSGNIMLDKMDMESSSDKDAAGGAKLADEKSIAFEPVAPITSNFKQLSEDGTVEYNDESFQDDEFAAEAEADVLFDQQPGVEEIATKSNSNTITTIATGSNRGDVLSKQKKAVYKEKEKNTLSRSLSEDEDLIGLLHITM